MLKKWSSSKAAGERKLEAYPQGYVDGFHEPRTKPGRARLGAQGPGRVKTGSFSASVEKVDAP